MKFEGNHELPSLEFIEDEGKLKIWGRSTSIEARADFWEPLIDKMDEYLNDPCDIVIELDFEYFSTVSAKLILEFLYLCQSKAVQHSRKTLVKWIYDDDDGREAGEDYASMVNKINWKFINKL